MLRQTGTAFADEEKALVRSSDGATRVTALVRVDAWQGGEYARAGVTLLGKYNLVFTGREAGQDRLEFVHDGSPGAAGAGHRPRPAPPATRRSPGRPGSGTSSR